MIFLLLGDDQETSRDLCDALKRAWPDAHVSEMRLSADVRQVLEFVGVDLLFVDVSSSGLDYAGLLERLHAISDAPIMALIRDNAREDRAGALARGADDCVYYPGDVTEFLARTRAVIRRSRESGFRPGSTVLVRGDLAINPSTAEVRLGGKQVPLTPVECRLLTTLARNEGEVVSSEVLLRHIWGGECLAKPGTVSNYMSRLRRKLESRSGRRMIVSQRGLGYRFSSQD